MVHIGNLCASNTVQHCKSWILNTNKPYTAMPMLRLMLNLLCSKFKQVFACYIQLIHQKKVLKFKFEPSYNVSVILTVTVDKEKIMPFLDMSTYLVIYCTYTDAQGSFCSNNTRSIALVYKKNVWVVGEASTTYMYQQINRRLAWKSLQLGKATAK